MLVFYLPELLKFQNKTMIIILLSFIVTTIGDVLCLEVDDSKALTWCVDAGFVVHAHVRLHFGGLAEMRF